MPLSWMHSVHIFYLTLHPYLPVLSGSLSAEGLQIAYAVRKAGLLLPQILNTTNCLSAQVVYRGQRSEE